MTSALWTRNEGELLSQVMTRQAFKADVLPLVMHKGSHLGPERPTLGSMANKFPDVTEQRWRTRRQTTGSGHVYQGRFKSFPIQEDDHFHTACRYVERNARRANLVRRAEDWRFSSLYRWLRGTTQEKSLLSPWPLPRRARWLDYVNAPQTAAELAAIRRSLHRGSPFGDTAWTEKMAGELGLESTLRPRGRPKKDICES